MVCAPVPFLRGRKDRGQVGEVLVLLPASLASFQPLLLG